MWLFTLLAGDSILESFSRAERRNCRRRDRNRLLGDRVDALAFLAVLCLKGAEPDKRDLIARFQCLGDRLYDRADSFFAVLFRKSLFFRNSGNQFCFRHF